METPEQQIKSQALEQATAIMQEHFDNIIIVGVDEGSMSPEVSTFGNPITLLGSLGICNMVIASRMGKVD